MQYLEKYQKRALDFLKSNNLKAENSFYDIILKLFSDIFPSEMLYSIWDIIIYYSIKAKNTVNNILIPLFRIIKDAM